MNMCCRCNGHIYVLAPLFIRNLPPPSTSKERETVCCGKLLFSSDMVHHHRGKREREATTLGFPLDKSASKMSDHSSSFFSLEFYTKAQLVCTCI